MRLATTHSPGQKETKQLSKQLLISSGYTQKGPGGTALEARARQPRRMQLNRAPGQAANPRGTSLGGKELFPIHPGHQQPAAPPGRCNGCLSAQPRAPNPSCASVQSFRGWREGRRSWCIPSMCQGLLEEAVLWGERIKNRRGTEVRVFFRI